MYALQIGKASSATFDLTLMICLLRNLIPIEVGDILPHPSDISTGADLSRLKYYRNKIAHSDAGVLTDKQLDDFWTDIAQVNHFILNRALYKIKNA